MIHHQIKTILFNKKNSNKMPNKGHSAVPKNRVNCTAGCENQTIVIKLTIVFIQNSVSQNTSVCLLLLLSTTPSCYVSHLCSIP